MPRFEQLLDSMQYHHTTPPTEQQLVWEANHEFFINKSMEFLIMLARILTSCIIFKSKKEFMVWRNNIVDSIID